MVNVPDEAVEAVARRNYEAEWGDGWDGVIPNIKRGWLNEARAQCEAAAPHLMAQGWDEGYRECYERQMYEPVPVNPYRKPA